ncbi:MAG TPA: (2Fe-2S)-binding protein [Devosiaceae bacterium]
MQFQAELALLASIRPELGLDQDITGNGLPPLSSVVDPESKELDRWLDDTATLASGIDAKTAAAYLISIFVWRLGDILGALYLRGTSLPPLTADDLAVRLDAAGQGRSRDIQFRFRFSPPAGGHSFDRAGLVRSIIAIHGPLIEALYEKTRLSRRALWRLVTDGISGGFLEYGRRNDCVDIARGEAIAILADTTAPLYNRQWRFIEIAPDTVRAEWFRLRGGCCRLYLTADGEYCTTCVLRSSESQVERLRSLVERRAS